MDTAKNLGKLSTVNVKKVWSHEAYDFTPWLCENIESLGNELGLELEFIRREEPVGPYYADILAKDTGTNKHVVIENQLNKTDHDHLGKCITYSSVLDASSFIWIATHFTDEHKKAIDWLNEHTTDDIECYAVKLELWQVDDSKPAVKYNIVCRPNKVVRAAKNRDKELTESQKLRLQFWIKFNDVLMARNKVRSNHSPKAQNYFDIPLGKSGITISNIVSTTHSEIGCRIYITSKVAEEWVPYFLGHREDVEEALGYKLAWTPNKDARDKVISISKDFELDNPDDWDTNIEWLAKTAEDFHAVFSKLIKDRQTN